MTEHAKTLAIDAADVARSYGEVTALAGVDLQVRPGQIVGVLGPNGAGKSTLIEILEGLRRRDRGSVSVLGEDPRRAGGAWRSRIGAVLQTGAETDELTVFEMLESYASYYPAPQDLGTVADALGLSDLLGRRVRRLSGGQRRRLDIGLGVIGGPELLFLDEPTTGLDPEVRRGIWSFIRELADDGTTVVLTTHYLEEAEQLADRVIVLVRGRVAARGTPSELAGTVGRTRVSFRLDQSVSAGDLPSLAGSPVSVSGADVTIETSDATALVGALMQWGGDRATNPIHDLTVGDPSLEETYLRLLDGQEEMSI